jgi:hypothetical protein
VSVNATGSVSQSSVGSVETASQAQQQAAANAQAAKQAKQRASSGTSTTSKQTTAAPKQTTTPQTLTTPAKTPVKTVSPPATIPTTRTVVRYVNHYQVHTVYRTRTKTKTVVKTVVKTVAPDLPVGAFLPSKHPELAQRSFTISGSNIGCQITGARVRCGIQNRAWAAPVQPVSCKYSWGDTIQLGGQGLASFACGGSNPISANAKVIPAGWDDKYGRVTCEIRRFGVNCFSTSRSGFTISRTGYSLY